MLCCSKPFWNQRSGDIPVKKRCFVWKVELQELCVV
jgi:hypothetical protein